MRIVNLKQNSPDWYAWRNKGLGASDAPTIVGSSPWSTLFELWGDKTGLLPKQEPNAFALAAMRRGNELEPEARAYFEKKIGIAFPPVTGEHDVHAFIRASLDGHNFEQNVSLEIKCPGKADHAKAVKGIVPDKYIPQLQQQMLVSGATKTFYGSYDGKEGVVVEVLADPTYQQALLQRLIEFWNLVETKTPPSVSTEDLSKIVEALSKELERINRLFDGLKLLTNALTVRQGDGVSSWAAQQIFKNKE